MVVGIYIHINKVVSNGRKKLNQLNRLLSNRGINISAKRLLLLVVLRPSLEYGSEIWNCNKKFQQALEALQLGAAKRILGCSSKTCNEAVWGDAVMVFSKNIASTSGRWSWGDNEIAKVDSYCYFGVMQ